MSIFENFMDRVDLTGVSSNAWVSENILLSLDRMSRTPTELR